MTEKKLTTEDCSERLREYRDSLYQSRESYIELNSRTMMGHPVTIEAIRTYNSIIKRFEELFPEMTEQPEVQRIR